MAFTIDTVTWRKDSHLPMGQGYSMRPGGTTPSTIVIHTTSSSRKNTAFASEAKYLRDSRSVSAHFLNGKDGQIAQILSPDLEAWHAGAAQSAYVNAHSIGIENHVSVGEQWTDIQHDSLTWLVRLLMTRYHITSNSIDTHRRVAIPGPDIRKHDPTGWADVFFYAWRAQLAIAPPPTPLPEPYRVRGLPVYQRSDHTGALWGFLLEGEQVLIDDPHNGHLADGRGFVDLAGLEML